MITTGTTLSIHHYDSKMQMMYNVDISFDAKGQVITKWMIPTSHWTPFAPVTSYDVHKEQEC